MKKLNFVAILMGAFISVTAAAEETVLGLICDHEVNRQELKMKVEIEVKGKSANLDFRYANELTALDRITVPASVVAPILANDLAAMDKVTAEDKKRNAVISFKVDGYTFDRKPRLKVEVAGAQDLDLTLTSCLADIDRPWSPY